MQQNTDPTQREKPARPARGPLRETNAAPADLPVWIKALGGAPDAPPEKRLLDDAKPGAAAAEALA